MINTLEFDELANPPQNVFIAGGNESHLRIDRSCLRSFRILETRSASSGVQAARLLAEEPPDLVLCDDTLGDMTGAQFIRLIRKHPRLAAVPVILSDAHSTEQKVLDAMDAGCSAYVVRPYSLNTLAQQLEAAMDDKRVRETLARAAHDASQEAFDQAIASFSKVVAKPDTSEEHFRQGIQHLSARRWDPAIAAFNRAVSINRAYAEAYEGLASAWRGKGRLDKYRHFMAKASQAYTKQKRFEEARHTVIELMKTAPDAANPFHAMASALIKKNDFQTAAIAYLQSHLSGTPATTIIRHMARSVHFTEDPKHAAKSLCQALSHSQFPTPETLYTRIMGPETIQKSPPPTKKQKPLTRLREVWTVASHTFHLFKNGTA